MNNKIILLACASFLFLNCKKEVTTEAVNLDSVAVVVDTTIVDAHNSQTALDWSGTYKGITPCADCEGIETVIVLNTDLTFVIQTKYLGKGDAKVFEEKGNFVWDNTGGIVLLQDIKGKPSQYKVGENKLIQLDMEGKAITGALAEKYVLVKE